MNNQEHHHTAESTNPFEYIKLIGVIIGIVVVSIYIAPYISNNSNPGYMAAFMGTFFLVFGLFKIFNLRTFADAFSGYDIIAQRYPSYGYIYPFLELWLALGFLTNIPNTPLATLTLMVVGSIGVYKALRRKSKFRCACLGTFINLPLTSISLIEDLSMGVMALLMILKIV